MIQNYKATLRCIFGFSYKLCNTTHQTSKLLADPNFVPPVLFLYYNPALPQIPTNVVLASAYQPPMDVIP